MMIYVMKIIIILMIMVMKINKKTDKYHWFFSQNTHLFGTVLFLDVFPYGNRDGDGDIDEKLIMMEFANTIFFGDIAMHWESWQSRFPLSRSLQALRSTEVASTGENYTKGKRDTKNLNTGNLKKPWRTRTPPLVHKNYKNYQ